MSRSRTSRRRLAAAGGAAALVLTLAACGGGSGGGGSAGGLSGTLPGAGASSQEKAMNGWLAGFQEQHPQVQASYDPVGSGTGREQFLNGAVLFAGSDKAMSAEEVAKARADKERLVAEAEKISAGTDWRHGADKLRTLFEEWKALPRLDKPSDDELWKRFRGAQDVFFGAKSAAMSEQDSEFKTNGVAKQALVEEAEAILPVRDLAEARAAYRSVLERWADIGKVPRERQSELERRLRAVEKRVRDAAESDRSDPEAEARAQQFRSRAEQFEQQAKKAVAAGRTKEAEEARASAAQWREWAETAEGALKGR